MKTSKYKFKIVCGFRKDQEHTIDANEVHKAYYLFRNPDKRGVFNNGLAVIGSDIRKIVPDYNAMMGWNPTHVLDGHDYNEINSTAIPEKTNAIISLALLVAEKADPDELVMPLIDLRGKYVELGAGHFAQQLLDAKNKNK